MSESLHADRGFGSALALARIGAPRRTVVTDDAQMRLGLSIRFDARVRDSYSPADDGFSSGGTVYNPISRGQMEGPSR